MNTSPRASTPGRRLADMALRLVAPFLGLLLIAVSCTSSGGETTAGAGVVTETTPLSTSGAQPGFAVTLTDVSELVKAVEASVVTVTQTQLQFDDVQGGEVPSGTGTGVVIDNEGHVLTNAHVVAGAQSVIVVGPDGSPRNAQVVGTWAADQNSDLALLLLEDPSGLEPISMGDSDRLEVGDPVVAIGNALGLGLSVSVGIVSAVRRQIRTDTSSIEDVLQTDAAINPGNSGGPLVNLRGEVVGVNELGGAGVGFAIPSNLVAKILNQVLTFGEVRRGWLGISVLPVEKLKREQGALVSSVVPSSPADRAGIQAGDLLVSMQGEPVNVRFFEQVPLFYLRVAELPAGKTVMLEIRRAGETRSVKVEVARMEKFLGEQHEYRGLGLVAQRHAPGRRRGARCVEQQERVGRNRGIEWRSIGLTAAQVRK